MTDFNPSAVQASDNLLADRRFVYGQALLKEGDGEGAADLFRQVIELVPDWAPAWLALGDAELLFGKPDAAVAAWQRCLVLHPADLLGAQPRLARLGVGGAANALGHGYVAALFDEYAERFDTHLTQALHYRAPQMLAEAVLSQGDRFGRVYDLGCGTGLMAASLAGHADCIAGCDLSPAMIEQARYKGLYSQLACLDAVAALQQEQPATIDLVVAADVFVYIGDLQPVLAASHTVLAGGGLMAFTAQSTEAGPVVIGEDLRAAHSRAYLEDTAKAASFAVVRLEAVSVRQDRGQPVPGWLCLLRKS